MTGTTLDDHLQLLAHGDRRRLIRHLRADGDTAWSVTDLADAIADPPADTDTDADGTRDRTVVATQLYHNHLPMLAAHGIIDYDATRGLARYTPDERLEALLDGLPLEESTPSP